MPALDQILLIVGAILVAMIFGSKLSVRLGVPALVLFLGVGLLLGEQGPVGIPFNDAQLAQTLGVVALAFILFSAGLNTEWGLVRPVFGQGLRLATLGVLISALLMGFFLSTVFHVSWLEGLLLGSVVSSTDAAAVFMLLRTRNVHLRGRLKELIEFESGSNDPMAVFLTLGVIDLILHPGTSYASLALRFVLQMGVGATIGYLMGRILVPLVNHARLEYEGLYPVLTIAMVALTYGVTTTLYGNGFLAAYVAGLMMGRGRFVHRASLRLFHDGVAWLMQIIMFVVLGLLVTPSQVVAVAGFGVAAALFLMLVARPVSVFSALAGSGATMREKTLISWVGLRGAAPIILATFPLVYHVESAPLIFDVVFFIVLISSLVQGTTIPYSARLLGLEGEAQSRQAMPIEFVPTDTLDTEMAEFRVREEAFAAGKDIVELGLPESALIMLISRDSGFILPKGGTSLQTGDTLLILAKRELLPAIREMVEGVSARQGR
jgi:cell volume regulation protein A